MFAQTYLILAGVSSAIVLNSCLPRAAAAINMEILFVSGSDLGHSSRH